MRDEYFERRTDFFDEAEYDISKYIPMDVLKLNAINNIRSQGSRYSKVTRRKLRLPKTYPFGEMILNDNVKQSR